MFLEPTTPVLTPLRVDVFASGIFQGDGWKKQVHSMHSSAEEHTATVIPYQKQKKWFLKKSVKVYYSLTVTYIAANTATDACYLPNKIQPYGFVTSWRYLYKHPRELSVSYSMWSDQDQSWKRFTNFIWIEQIGRLRSIWESNSRNKYKLTDECWPHKETVKKMHQLTFQFYCQSSKLWPQTTNILMQNPVDRHMKCLLRETIILKQI